MNTLQLIKKWPGLSDEARRILAKGCASRGKHKGFVRATCPSARDDLEAFVAWQTLVSNLAPSRVNIFSVLIWDEGRMLERLDSAIEQTKMGEALRAVEPDFRWNLYAHRFDTSKIRDALEKALS
jgi:hypothetical protein